MSLEYIYFSDLTFWAVTLCHPTQPNMPIPDSVFVPYMTDVYIVCTSVFIVILLDYCVFVGLFASPC